MHADRHNVGGCLQHRSRKGHGLGVHGLPVEKVVVIGREQEDDAGPESGLECEHGPLPYPVRGRRSQDERSEHESEGGRVVVVRREIPSRYGP